MSLRIDLRETIDKNAHRILAGRLEKCRTALQQEDHHEAIHDTRKQIKKIRALARLLRKELGEDTYQRTNQYYRDVARQLSDARDAAAMLETLALVAPHLEGEAAEAAFTDIKHHLSSRKSAVSRALNQDNLLQKTLADLDEAEALHAKWKIKHEDFSAFAGGLGKTYQRCREAMDKAYKKDKASEFHEWRKRCKYLRYEVDLLREVWHQPMKSLEKELHQLTDYLGDHHDLAVLKKYLKTIEIDHQDAMNAVFSVIDTKKQELQRLAKPLGEKILLDNKKEFVQRLQFYWKKSLKEFKLQQEAAPLSVA